MRDVRIALGVVLLVAFGWAVDRAAASRTADRTVFEVVVREVDVQPESPWWIDELVDFDEVDRQSECLWEFLKDAGVEITFRNVWTAGEWTDALGGACLVIGEDDE